MPYGLKNKVKILLAVSDPTDYSPALTFPSDTYAAQNFEEAKKLIVENKVEVLITDETFIRYLGKEEVLLAQNEVIVLVMGKNSNDAPVATQTDLSNLLISPQLNSVPFEKKLLQASVQKQHTAIFIYDDENGELLKEYKAADSLFNIHTNTALADALTFFNKNPDDKEAQLSLTIDGIAYSLHRIKLWNDKRLLKIVFISYEKMKDQIALSPSDYLSTELLFNLPLNICITDGHKILFANKCFADFCNEQSIKDPYQLTISNTHIFSDSFLLSKSQKDSEQVKVHLHSLDINLVLQDFTIHEIYYQNSTAWLLRQKSSSTSDLLRTEDFLQIASHDLREPLRMITGYAQLIKRKLQDPANQELKSYAEIIFSSGKNLDDYLKKLKELSQFIPDTAPFVPINFSEMVSTAKRSFASEIKEIKYEILVKGNCDITMAEKDLSGLLRNMMSILFSHSNLKSPFKIICNARNYSGGYFISMRDNGNGLSETLRSNFDNAFRQLNFSAEEKRISLSYVICKKILQKYKGHIWIDSETGVGTEITVTMEKFNS